MEEKEEIPKHVFDRFKSYFNTVKDNYPNIVRTRNINNEGVKVLIEKNKLLWFKSIYIETHTYIEGVVKWGSSNVFVYFKKVDNESTYKIYILTNNLENIEMLLMGLNKFFTIDKI